MNSEEDHNSFSRPKSTIVRLHPKLVFYLQLGHVPRELVVLHTIRFLRQSFFQHSSQTMIWPRSLWLAESKVMSSLFFPQSLHSPIFLSPSYLYTFLSKMCICIKIYFTEPNCMCMWCELLIRFCQFFSSFSDQIVNYRWIFPQKIILLYFRIRVRA